jgi:hypothetical protein
VSALLRALEDQRQAISPRLYYTGTRKNSALFHEKKGARESRSFLMGMFANALRGSFERVYFMSFDEPLTPALALYD